jgi:hypothetical protein
MTFKWTAPRTWVAAEKPPASTLNDHIRNNLEALNGYKEKTADESVTSSTTLQDDNHLLFSIPQAGTYVFDARLFMTSAANAAGDIKVGFTFPTGTCHFAFIGLDDTLASGFKGPMHGQGALSATSGTTALALGLSTSTLFGSVQGILIATASGTLTLQWAQLASNASASTVKSGSHMLVRQVA